MVVWRLLLGWWGTQTSGRKLAGGAIGIFLLLVLSRVVLWLLDKALTLFFEKILEETFSWQQLEEIMTALEAVFLDRFVLGAVSMAALVIFGPLLWRAGRARFAQGEERNIDSDGVPQPKGEASRSVFVQMSQRFIDLIDAQDELINSHISTVRQWIKKYYDAADPYIEINIEIKNSSLFDLTYAEIRGRLFYSDDPLPSLPEVVSHSLIIRPGSLGKFCIRQFISANLRDRLIERRGHPQELAPSADFCLVFSYENRRGVEKEAQWTIFPNLFDISELAPKVEPDWNLSQAFQYWAEVTDRSDTFHNDLEQAAFDENISIWGKRDYLNDAIMEKIPPIHWSKSQVEMSPAIYSPPEQLDESFILERSRTVARSKADTNLTQYWQLKVSSIEMKARFGP